MDLDSQLTSFDHFTPGFRLTDSKTGSNGFTLVDEKGAPDSLSRQVGNYLIGVVSWYLTDFF